MAPPRMVTLRLTKPRMGVPSNDGNAALIEAVQYRLRGYGIEQDGTYGPRTALAVAVWQERVGCPHVAGAIVPSELLVLLGYRKVPSEWVANRGDPARAHRAYGWQTRLKIMARDERPSGESLVIIPRSSWCPYGIRGRSVVNHYAGVPHVVHWFGPGAAATTRAGGIAQTVGFARYHIYTLGWADLGYNWVILRDGANGGLCTVLEGRGRDTRGAHSGHNTANTYPGVLVLCGTSTPTPTSEQYATLQALRTKERWGRRYGHIEFYSTSCPGPVLWPWVKSHR